VGFLNVLGKSIPPESLQNLLAKELLIASKLPFVELIETRVLDVADIVVLDISVERPRDVVYPIDHVERIAIICFNTFGIAPEVLALRDDFPHTPHINLRDDEFPRSLCLYDQPLEQLQLRQLTGAKLIETIRQWLTLTALGQLHAKDQPLEPLWFNSNNLLIIPPEMANVVRENPITQFRLKWNQDHLGRFIFQVSPTSSSVTPNEIPTALCVGVFTKPVQHGVIRKTPKTLYELHQTLTDVDYDLILYLRSIIREQMGIPHLNKNNVILLIALPKMRFERSPVEKIEWRAFLMPKLQEVAFQIGIWDRVSDHSGLLLSPDETRMGQDTVIDLLDVVHTFTREQAALLNGLKSPNTQKIVQIGVGALGSQVFSNLSKAGFGKFTIIDHDRLMPHNLARHALSGHFVGFNKANSMAKLINGTLPNNSVTSIPEDILQLQKDELKIIFSDAFIILDCSASVPVARYLTSLESNARRVSLFLSPNGKDLVLLAEDSARHVKLDQLEAQYYQSLIDESSLEGHLATNHSRIRYGASCRDISSTIPQDFVALHAAIGSRAFKQVSEHTSAQISIWRTHDVSYEVLRFNLTVQNMHILKVGSWELHISYNAVNDLQKLRVAKLPRETGGTLIGMIDLQHKNIYLTGVLPAPEDSQEYPTLFIRGSTGLANYYQEISSKTLEMLEYLGEWHSHPNGYKTNPSNDDNNVLEWIRGYKDIEGLPSLMVIVGESDMRFFVTDPSMDDYLEVCL
jgi:hypothetical protein